MAGEEGGGANAWSAKDERRVAEIDRIHIVSPTFGTRMLKRQGEVCATRLQAEKAHRYLPLLPALGTQQGVEAGLVPAEGQEGPLLQPGLLHKRPDKEERHTYLGDRHRSVQPLHRLLEAL